MPLSINQYEKISHHMHPGDIIAFGGHGRVSKFINFTTDSPVSHVATIYQTSTYGHHEPQIEHHIAESAKHRKFIGVTFTLLSTKIAAYNGNVWWLPLNMESRATLNNNFQQFHDFIVEQHTKKFDVTQAFRSAMEANSRFSFINKLKTNTENHNRFFCSELVSAALVNGGVLPKMNSSEITPADLCRYKIFAPAYVQLKGSTRHIEKFNSIRPRKF